MTDQAATSPQYGLDKPVAHRHGRRSRGPRPRRSRSSSARSRRTARASTPSSPAASKVYLLPSWVEGSFDKKPFDLRDRDLLHVKRDDVRQLEVTGPEGGYALARTDAGEWAFTKPLATRAGRWAVDGLLGTVESLRMESVAARERERREGARGASASTSRRARSLS